MTNTGCMLCAPPHIPRQYCSQACLRGLRYSSKTKIPRKLDPACPNAALHPKTSKRELTLDQFHNLLQRQLHRSHTDAIKHLGLGGSSGQMYAILLCSHGYTFVGKGSRSDEVPTLVHEFVVYESCHPLQGKPIPVCLGLLDLDGPCYLESPNFLLLSCGGIRLQPGLELIPPADVVISSAKRALKKLHDFNVTHRDLCVENLLWSTELQCARIVHFGKSALLEIPGVPPSARHRLSSSQNGHRRVVPNVKLSSSAGVRKGRKTRYRHGELMFLMGERRCELAAIEMEILRWLPKPAT